jgi:hypothetical protein
MKKKGTISQLQHERDDDLMRAFQQELAGRPHILLPEVLNAVVSSPSKRFWVTSERAAIVIYNMMKGDELEHMRPLKRKMFREIYRRVMKLKANYPQLSIPILTEQVVAEPAPEFYITPGSAKVIISRIRKRRRIHNHKIRR